MKSSIYYSALSEATADKNLRSRVAGSTFSVCVVLFELIDEKQKSSRQHCYLFIFHISFLSENWRHKILTPFSTLFFPLVEIYFIVFLGYISLYCVDFCVLNVDILSFQVSPRRGMAFEKQDRRQNSADSQT